MRMSMACSAGERRIHRTLSGLRNKSFRFEKRNVLRSDGYSRWKAVRVGNEVDAKVFIKWISLSES